MLYKDEDGKTRRLKPLEKMPTINDKNREFWKKRSMTWRRYKIFFPSEIKTGVCYFCKKEGRAQKSRRTALHHIKYNNDDPLEWTVEVCNSCHYQIDAGNKKIIQRNFAPRNFAKLVDKQEEMHYEKIRVESYYDKMRKSGRY